MAGYKLRTTFNPSSIPLWLKLDELNKDLCIASDLSLRETEYFVNKELKQEKLDYNVIIYKSPEHNTYLIGELEPIDETITLKTIHK